MPRKSTASTAIGETAALSPYTKPAGDISLLSTGPDASTKDREKDKDKDKDKEKSGRQSTSNEGVGVDDLLLPRTLTSRLARGILPPNTSIQKDALLALTKSATVFISYLASHANEMTTKKTIGPQDVIKALAEIEMAGVMDMAGRLERELEVWEGVVRGKRRGYREKIKGRESGVGEGEGEVEPEGEREAKRVRIDEETGAEGSAASVPPSETANGNANANGHPTLFSDDDAVEDDALHDEEQDEDGTESDDQAEDNENEEDEAPRDEDADLDGYGYGPDEQLRRDMIMNGEEGGTEDESN